MRRFHVKSHWRAALAALLVVVAVIVLVPTGFAAALVSDAESVFGSGPAPKSAAQVKTVNGVTLHLTGVKANAAQTSLHFTVSLPSKVAASDYPYVVQLFGTHLALDGIGKVSSGGVGIQVPVYHKTGETHQSFALVLGPTSGTQPATVTFQQLNFAVADRKSVTVQGPWSFTLTPSLLSENQPVASVPVTGSAKHAGLTVTIDQVESRKSGLTVHFSLKSESHPVMRLTPDVRIVFPDGSSEKPTLVSDQTFEPTTKPNLAVGQTKDFTAEFPPLKKHGGQASFQVSNVMVSEDLSASVTIEHPFGNWSAAPIQLHGETLKVTKVTPLPNNDGLMVTVENTEPLEHASVVFLSMDPRVNMGTTAVDSAGHVYHESMGSAGMRRTNAGTMGAGSTQLQFVGIPSTVNQITVKSPASGIFYRGPWSVTVPLP